MLPLVWQLLCSRASSITAFHWCLHDRRPFILTLSLCRCPHALSSYIRSIIKQFKYAWVWGRSVKHQPQRVGKDHVLEDEDIVQIVKK